MGGYDPPVVNARMRSGVGIAGRVLLGAVVAVLLAGAVLVILAYYGDLTFDIEQIVLAVAVAGVLVFLWTRWR